MASTNQMIKTTALIVAILIPVAIIASMVYGMWPSPDPERRVQCGARLGSEAEPILNLEDDQCLAIAKAIEIVHRERPDELTTFDKLTEKVEIGEPVPATVSPIDLPSEVTTRHPELKPYRYFLVADNIALVDPSQSQVVAFVDVQVSSR